MSEPGVPDVARVNAGLLFGGFFVATLLLGFAVMLALHLNVHAPTPDRVTVPPLAERLEKHLPEIFRDHENDVRVVEAEMARVIGSAVDSAFEAVYAQIPTFLDFHYSVIGEYVELAAAASPLVTSRLEKMLVEDTELGPRMDAAVADIGAAADGQIQWLLSRLRGRLQDGLQLGDQEVQELAELARLTHEDMLQRFGASAIALRGSGATVGGVAVGAALAKVLGPKVAAKLAVKAAGKVAIKASGAGGAALTGAAFGTLCGPAVVICAPAGAIGGALAGWVIVDKAIVETDEWFNRDEFEREIVSVLDAERLRIREELVVAQTQLLAQIFAEAQRNLEGVKVRDLL